MRRRVLELFGVAAAVVGVIALLQLAPVPVEGQAQQPTDQSDAEPATPTPWGEPDLQGIWTTDFLIPLERPARFADQEFLTDEQRAELDQERARIIYQDTRYADRGSEQDVGGAYSAAIYLSHKYMGRRTSLIIDPPNGRIPPLTPEAQARRDAIREYQLALIQATAVCRDNLPSCAGGTYGPPSPRRNEPPPFYPATGAAAGGSFNRSDGPEDRGLGERCMSARLPDFGGRGRLLPADRAVARDRVDLLRHRAGAGLAADDSRDRPPAPAAAHPAVVGRFARAAGRATRWWSTSPTSRPRPTTRARARTCTWWSAGAAVDAETLEYIVTMNDPTTWTAPWTVALELSRQSDQLNRIYKEPRCHEGNYGMPALLRGARAEEQEFADGTGPDPATLCSAGCGGFAAGFADSGDEVNPLSR